MNFIWKGRDWILVFMTIVMVVITAFGVLEIILWEWMASGGKDTMLGDVVVWAHITVMVAGLGYGIWPRRVLASRDEDKE